ncbi:hypothetical protein FB45DRAFT_757693 [Roridomyces roridus]|uniref:Enoyl reductase (ER) domain-containing protein n=1 Tax=Roridomyces roridus TaxID=1738132 RepID=A0AAD7BBI0_9AGAR|nr:hypothetical protein FB45DRAFT_757693 [Roridomyces roridus]
MAIPTTMLAARYVPGHERLVIDRHYPLRSDLKDDEVLIKMSAAGVCHSDVGFLSGVTMDERTYVMGHEACGVHCIPRPLGPKVDAFSIHLGKLYAVLAVDSCMNPTKGTFGVGLDGAYAEYFIATVDQTVPVPHGVAPEVAAIACDAGVTAYNAVQHAAQVRKGDKILIFGIGGLGHLAVQYARYFGATVYVCDFKVAVRKLALELGPTEAFDWIELDKRTKEGFTVDTTIDFIASNQSFTSAMAALQGNGAHFPSAPKLVLVGFSAENLVFNTLSIILSGVQIVGNTYGPQSALVEVLDLFAKDIIRAHVSAEPLENVNRVIDELRSFEIVGRKVVVPPKPRLEEREHGAEGEEEERMDGFSRLSV